MSQNLVKIYEVEGRQTGMGAVTKIVEVVAERGVIKVRRARFSKSGNHWVEEVWATPDADGYFVVKNISDSGKDYSYVAVVCCGQVVKKIPLPPNTWLLDTEPPLLD